MGILCLLELGVEMNCLSNRTLYVVRATEEMLTWVNSLKDTEGEQLSLEEVNEDSSAYLLDSGDELEEMAPNDLLATAVEDNWEEWFLMELRSWTQDEKEWPQEISLEMFEEWFDVSYHSMIVDMSEEDYLIEEYE